MDYSDDQEPSIAFERTEIPAKNCNKRENIFLDKVVEDEGCLDISSMLEVVLKEEQGSFIPLYYFEEFSDLGKNSAADFAESDISEDFKVVDTGFSTKKEIGSLNSNTCEDIETIQKMQKRFQCRICDHISNRSSDLSRHVKEVHLKYKPYHCGICGYRTYRIYTLRIHMQSVHKGIKRHCYKYSSTAVMEASKKFNDHQELQQVFPYPNKMITLHDCVKNINKKEKTFFCSFCHLRTKWAGSLRNHIFAVHMKEKPHYCPMCNYKSSARYSVMRHIEAVHMKNKPHSCPLCPYKSTRSDTLKVHMKRLHPGNGLMIGNT